MEFRHLQSFIAVAEELSFTRAALRLHIAQSPLSRRIRQLEEELGLRLFVRDRRTVTLTDAGRLLLDQARILTAQSLHFFDTARRASKGEAGIIRIGIALGTGEKINLALVEHARRFPAVEIQCKDIVSTRQNEALREFQIDVGFLRPPIDHANLRSETVFQEKFVALIPAASPLARQRRIKLRQLASEPLLVHPRDVSIGVYDKILQLYREAGVTPKSIIHTSAFPYHEAGAILVASGRGIVVGVGAMLARPALGGKVIGIPLDQPRAFIDVHVAWRKTESSPAVLAFLDTVRTVFRHPARSDSALRVS